MIQVLQTKKLFISDIVSCYAILPLFFRNIYYTK